MKNQLLLFALALSCASLAGCGGGSGGGAPRTVMTIAAQEINTNTAEDSVPIQINDLPISDRDTDQTSSPTPIN